jgi:hypothetical protein
VVRVLGVELIDFISQSEIPGSNHAARGLLANRAVCDFNFVRDTYCQKTMANY